MTRQPRTIEDGVLAAIAAITGRSIAGIAADFREAQEAVAR